MEIKRVDYYKKDNLMQLEAQSRQDRGYCSVMTLATVIGTTYLKAYKWLMNRGFREYQRGVSIEQVEKWFDHLKTWKIIKGDYSPDNKITLGKFIEKHNKGRFFVVINGHALAVIDGVLFDHTEGLGRQVLYAYRFIKKKT